MIKNMHSSEGSMLQHIKLKHGDNKSEEKIIE